MSEFINIFEHKPTIEEQILMLTKRRIMFEEMVKGYQVQIDELILIQKKEKKND